MKKISFLVVAVALLAWSAAAQTSASSQTGASSSTQASASAGKSNAQVQSSTAASQQAQPSRGQPGQKGAQPSGSASGSAANSSLASANAGPASLDLSSGSTINAVLLTSVDARKNKPGDRVVAKTTEDVKQDGHVVLRKGSKLIGHVTEAQAKGRGNAQSSLGITFDQAVVKNGQQAPVNFTIQALAAAQSASSAAFDQGELGPSTGAMSSGGVAGAGRVAGGGLVGGATSTVSSTVGAAGGAAGSVGRTAGATVGSTANTASSATGNAGGLNTLGQLTSSSSGVFGLKGLNLSSGLSSATQGSGSIVTSSTRNVHLASGTQLLLRATGQAQANK